MSKAILLGLVVAGAGMIGYQTYLRPSVSEAIDSAAPVAESVGNQLVDLKNGGEAAMQPVKDSPLGQKAAELWDRHNPFFDPMPVPPAEPRH